MPSRERILAFGGAGCGKTDAWIKMALRSAKSGNDAVFHVIDTDYTTSRSLEPYPHLEANGFVRVHYASDYDEYVKARDAINRESAPHHWKIIDMVAPTWEFAQEEFIDAIFGKSYDKFFLDARKTNEKGGALDGYKDWGVINKMYRKLVAQDIMQSKCHVFATAPAQALNAEKDDKTVVALYARHGVKPVGQKLNSHSFHTVLWFKAPKQDEWTMTTIKDRGRESLMAAPIGDFSINYCVRVAKWRLV